MKKAWINYTVASVFFFIICLTIVIFFNKPVFKNIWEEALLIVAIANLVLSYIYFRNNKDAFATRRRPGEN